MATCRDFMPSFLLPQAFWSEICQFHLYSQQKSEAVRKRKSTYRTHSPRISSSKDKGYELPLLRCQLLRLASIVIVIPAYLATVHFIATHLLFFARWSLSEQILRGSFQPPKLSLQVPLSTLSFSLYQIVRVFMAYGVLNPHQ